MLTKTFFLAFKHRVQFSIFNRSRQRLFGSLALLFSSAFTFHPLVYADQHNQNYQLGRGYNVANTGINLGGYASVGIDGFGSNPWSFNVNDLSLFISWDNGGRFRFFSEIEVEDLISAGENQNITTSQANFRLERLYIDYLANHNLTVRLGKMLTPFGQWNLIHADPLVWTSTRPVATQTLFPDHATGLMLHGSVSIAERSLDYAVYADYDSALDPEPIGNLGFDNALGARIRYGLTDQLKLGISYANFALIDSPGVRNNLVGLDLSWDYQGYQITSEIAYRDRDAPLKNQEWQGFVQGVVPIKNKLYAVGRYEFFDQVTDKTGQVGVFGLAYRPKPPLVFKLEYRQGEHNRQLAPDGLFASFAVLF